MPLAAKCVPVTSSWVQQFVLTCDDKLAVQFRNGVCCLYPSSNKSLFELAITWASPGKFVHAFLYKKLPYKLIEPPCPAHDCGGVVPTGCCPNAIPSLLFATISGGGICNGSYVITYDPTDPIPAWKSSQALGSCNTGTTIRFNCSTVTNIWTLTVGPTPTSSSLTNCSPFQATFTGLDITFCGGTSNATVTVTP